MLNLVLLFPVVVLGWLWPTVGWWLVLVEAVWWFAVVCLLEQLDRRPAAFKASRSRQAVAKLFADEFRGDAGRRLISGWFFDRPYASISREALKRWWAWARCCDVEVDEALEADVRAIEAALGMLEGGPEEQRSVRLNLDSVRERVLTKPLWLYVVLRGACGSTAAIALWRMGFYRRPFGRLWFWIRDGPGQTVLFLHGLGVGILPYIPLLRLFPSHFRLIIPDLWYASLAPPIELWVKGGVPDRDEHLRAIDAALGPTTTTTKVDVFGHSYGTVVAAWLLHARPDRIRVLALAEPVALLVHHAHVARNFLYDPAPDLPRALVKRVVGMDPVVVHLLMRNFWWFENTIFVRDLKDTSTIVFLSEKDEVVPSSLIRQRLLAEAPGVGVVWTPSASHGDTAFNPNLAQTYVRPFVRLQKKAEEDLAVDRGESPPRRREILVEAADI
ncbi:hypothetical protein CTAYLR_010612 [Chrysophaeum taylorii]|uniref:AB hydrolase-1 domain-containing protein n=1 Tax=Chrysophaeum taylorii TaxID=2483200 RepID=A0AAD7XNR2_9STRA|nr:hypothetical protein CTAYLR_010612 [Chrysophaeum taylorii]